MEPVQSCLVGITLQYHRFHIVVQHFARHIPKKLNALR
ncbi:hypothetical protein D083_1143 [Dickeya solani RNS 08.23.3.1.A]|nr:hypothetical protein D083_1143 [Dickeya solani RNS 08.23.3.1.A]